jgi:hypothetical protein
MKWKKGKVIDNESKTLPLWTSDCKTYEICQSINGGIPSENYKGEVDRHGHRWLFEVTKINGSGKEAALGVAPTLKSAKAIAEADADGI